MFMMTLYVLSGLSIPTKNFKFSLPIYMFRKHSNIYKLDFNYVVDVSRYLQNTRPGLNLSWKN